MKRGDIQAAEMAADDLSPSCPRCGDLLALDALYCPECGARVLVDRPGDRVEGSSE